MNKGIEKSKGDWLYFLGGGDKFENNMVLQNIFSKQYPKNSLILSGKVIYKGDTKPFIYSKTKKIMEPSWNFSMWIRNGLHHQGTFYKKNLFDTIQYDLTYPIFSDYWFNLLQYKNKVNCFLLDELIAICNSGGVSKSGSIRNYKEEMILKVNLSLKALAPLFFVLVSAKYLIRKLYHKE